MKRKCNITGLRNLTDDEIFKYRADVHVKEKLNGQLDNYAERGVDANGCVKFDCGTIKEWDFMNKLSFYKIYIYATHMKKPPVIATEIPITVPDVVVTPVVVEVAEETQLQRFSRFNTTHLQRSIIGTELLSWLKIDVVYPGNFVVMFKCFLQALLGTKKFNVDIVGVSGKIAILTNLLSDPQLPLIKVSFGEFSGDIVVLERCVILTPDIRATYRPTSQHGSRILMKESYYNQYYGANPNVVKVAGHPYLCTKNMANFFPTLEKHNIDKVAWVNSKSVAIKGVFDEGIIEDFNLLQQQFPKTVVTEITPVTLVLWDGEEKIDKSKGLVYSIKHSHVMDGWYLGQILRGAGALTIADLENMGFSKTLLKEYSGNALVVDSQCDLQSGIVYYIPQFQLSMVLPSLNLRAGVEVVGPDLYKFTPGRLIYYANCDHGGNVFKHKHIANVTPKQPAPEVVFSVRRLINFPSVFRYATGVKYWGQVQVDKVLKNKEYVRHNDWCVVAGKIVWNPLMYKEDTDYILVHDGADFNRVLIRIAFLGFPMPKMEHQNRRSLLESGEIVESVVQTVKCEVKCLDLVHSRLEYMTYALGWPVDIEIICDEEDEDVLTPGGKGFQV